MKFLTKEHDLVFPNNGLLYFYDSQNSFPQDSLLVNILSESNDDIIGIDLAWFKTMVRRFNLEQTPTIIVITGGVESKRISGIPSISDIENILDNA